MDLNLSLHHQARAAYLRRIGPDPTAPTSSIRVQSGAEITLDLPDLSGGQITRESAVDGGVSLTRAFGGLEGAGDGWDKCGFGFGPVYVEDAEFGDVLKVEVLSVAPKEDYAWTALVPGFGSLYGERDRDWLYGTEDATDQEYQMVKIWNLKTAARDGYLVFKESNPRIHVPYAPCLGIIGLAPDPLPANPYMSGENEEDEDIKYITPGSSISLPVKVRGALLSIGDAHATHGSAEVCGTGVEMAAKAQIRVTVEKNTRPYPFTFINIPGPTITLPTDTATEPKPAEDTHYIGYGVEHTVEEATELATYSIVDPLSSERKLTRREAYMLFSAAGSLRRLDDPEEVEELCELESSIPFNFFVEQQ